MGFTQPARRFIAVWWIHLLQPVHQALPVFSLRQGFSNGVITLTQILEFAGPDQTAVVHRGDKGGPAPASGRGQAQGLFS